MTANIDALIKAGKNAAEIATSLDGVVVEGGFYSIGIKVGNTIYYHPGL